MIILIDIGNTTLEFALVENNNIVEKHFVASKPFNYAEAINYLGKLKENIDINNAKVVVSSVVPEVNIEIENILLRYTKNIKFLQSEDFIGIVKTEYDINKVGKDILCKTAWVALIEKKDTIILDVGTATVLQYIKKDGHLVGASITAGLSTIYKALHSSTSLLPLITPKETKSILGKNTIECIENGVFWGYVGCASKLIEKTIEETKCTNIYLTGGLSHLIKDYFQFPIHNNKNIIFEAILAVSNYNKLISN